jgi:cytochrome c-type biogenesis protein CcmH/NrfG
MSREAIVAGLSGIFFGLLVGWILGAQGGTRTAPSMAAGTPPAGVAPASGGPAAPALDVARATELERRAKAEPGNANIRIDLGNLYMDAKRFDLAIPWYEGALQISPRDVNVSTDLAVCYYSTNQIDRALAQIDKSLAIDPSHVKTLFNQGVIRAWGREDLAGAVASWERVVALDPNGEDGRRAKAAIDTMKQHPPVSGGSE